MTSRHPTRLLSIGEFSAATQLTPKALRLYDEQCILRPAVVDAANGYRYYRDEQIPLGRLIRTLRDMDLPLASVADVVAADAVSAEALLRQFSQEGELRLMRQKRAGEAALSLLRQGRQADAPVVEQRARVSAIVAVRPFLADRRCFIERYRSELAAGFSALAELGLTPTGEPFCSLLDPVSDEEGRAEMSIPIEPAAAIPRGLTLRQSPARECAVLVSEISDAGVFETTSALDALFDWLDRRGCHALESPTVSIASVDAGLRVEISWAFGPVAGPSLMR